MQSYRVIALSLGGRRNKVFSLGEVVTQAQLAAPVNDLVSGGYLEAVASSNAEEVEVEVVETAEVEAPETKLVEKVEEAAEVTGGIPAFSDLSKKQIIARLKEADAKFNKTWTKKSLYSLLEEVS